MERWRSTQLAVDHTCTAVGGPAAGAGGATLIELLASLLLMSILMAMAYGFARAALMSVRVQEVKSEVQEVSTMAVDILARELRMAGFSAAAGAMTAVAVALPDRVEIASDFNGDGDSADTNEVIAYSYDAAKQQLMRATGGGSPQPFARNVAPAGVQFTFFDAAGTQIPAAASGLSAEDRQRIRRVDVLLRLEIPHPDPTVSLPVASTVSNSVYLRNR